MSKDVTEQYSETLIRKLMSIDNGECSFGFVYPQGDVSQVPDIEACLKAAGGKPSDCSLDDFSKDGTGKAKPEYILTFKDTRQTVLVIECKRSPNQHCSDDYSHPKKYACDGVLYYAKYLKESYNVIAVAMSGSKENTYRADAWYWARNQSTAQILTKAHDVILEPENYLKLINGEKIQRAYSLEQIRTTASEMNNALRDVKVSEKTKPIFVAGILIALTDQSFVDDYDKISNFNAVVNRLLSAIDDCLENSDIPNYKKRDIKQSFQVISQNQKMRSIPLGQRNSITWYIKELEMKIKPMMDFSGSTVDSLGVFYQEFVRYTGGDGKGLGIVLTPQHLTEFMAKLAGVTKSDCILDPCCGSGTFLVTSMGLMLQRATADEVDEIKKQRLYGIELDPEIYVLSIANMIVRGDGKSNIIHGDCFNKDAITKIDDRLRANNQSRKADGKSELTFTVGLLNPPYSQEDVEELEFVEMLLNKVAPRGRVVCVVPTACSLGTKYKTTRKRLFENHRLDAVFSMPDDIFYPTGVTVCVMVWEAHVPHDSSRQTFFGYCKDDGFTKAKKLGRIDKFNRWNAIEDEWLRLYHERDAESGKTAKHCVTDTDEWICEAYMETDYSNLTQDTFEVAVRDYVAFLAKEGITQ